MDIKLAKTNIRKQVGGSLLTSILTLGRAALPTIAKTLGLSALGGLASAGAQKLVGSGMQKGGFLIPQNKINQLIQYKHLLSDKQRKDLLNALQSGSGVNIKPTKKQSGGALGTILASIGIPLLLNALTGQAGRGAPQMGRPRPRPSRSLPDNNQDGHGHSVDLLYRPPPFYGTWETKGYGMVKKKSEKKRQKRATVYF